MLKINKIKKLYRSIYINEIFNSIIITSPKIDEYTNIFYDFKSTSFFPKKMSLYLDKCNKILKISYKYIHLHYIYYDVLNESIYKILRTIKHIYVIKKLYNIEKNFNIYILFSPYKRHIRKGYITPYNINGGFTNTNNNDIFIIRREDYTKVIIHELMHHHKLLNMNNWDSNILNELKRSFNIADKTILLPNEAIIELFAVILHTMFLSFEYNIDYYKLLDKEKEFAIIQYSKLLKKQNNNEWYESTNAYCYIVFKTILLCNIDIFLKYFTIPYDTKYIKDFLLKYKNTIKLKKVNDNSFKTIRFSEY